MSHPRRPRPPYQPPPPPGILEGAWLDYVRLVGLLGAPPDQMRECRRAFYGGVISLRHILLGSVSEGEEITADDEELMHKLDAEIDRYGRDVEAGRA